MRKLEAGSHPPSLIQLGARVFLVIGVLFIGLIGWWMALSWDNVKQSQQRRMDVVATLVASQTQSYLEVVGQHLMELADELTAAEAWRHPERGLPILLDFKQHHADLGGAALILPDGSILSATLAPPGSKLPNLLQLPGWREDFRSALQASALSVGRPQQAPLIKKWVIPLRFTVRDAAGSPLYVLQTGILLEHQQSLWANLRLNPGEVLGLLRDDGQLISRLPSLDPARHYQQRHPAGGMLAAIGRQHAASRFETVGLDGQSRFGASQRLQRYPLHAFISLPVAIVRQIWWQEVRLPLLLMFTLMIGGGGAYVWLARRFAGRMGTIRGTLERGPQPGQKLPSSGVHEIDSLCVALAESQERLRKAANNRERSLLGAAEAGTYAVRARDNVVIEADEAFLGMLGLRREQVVGHAWDKLVEPTQGMGASSGELAPHHIVGIRRTGGHRWLSLAEYEEVAGSEAVRYGLAIDVTEREQSLAMVGAQSARFQALWQLATNRGKSEREKADLMLKLALESLNMEAALIGENVGDQIIIRHAVDSRGLFKVGEACQLSSLCQLALDRGSSFLLNDLAASETFASHPLVLDGSVGAYASVPVWVEEQVYGTLAFLRRAPIEGNFSENDRIFIELLSAWFGQMMLQQKQHLVLENMAMTDSLTGLPNRRAAELRFVEEIARAQRDGIGFAVAICDLDRFKLINDHYGHEVGDEVLQGATRLMRQALRECDWMARWGGEEFILFLHQSGTADAVKTVERIRQSLKEHPVITSQGEIPVTASFGIGVYAETDGNVSRVLSEADGCLYEAKEKGRDCIVASDQTSRTTLWRAGMLQHALQEQRIVPAYQVMVELAGGQTVADETLARLVLPDGKIIAAGEFIEAAEGINLIHAVDDVIARQALVRCAVNLRDGKLAPNFAHFVNLSPQFLARTDLVQALLTDAQNYCAVCNVEFSQVKPIVFEITERQLISDFTKLRADLQPLLDFGFRLALDDFGSGYSSFLYLAELPVSFLKIEGWMVLNMRSNARVLTMVQSVVMLARELGITTIAECVEDRETAEMLREMGVNWGQGYYFGRPECEFDVAKRQA